MPNNKPKKLLPPEYITTHVKANNLMTVEYTYWIKSGSKGDLFHYVGHQIKAPMQSNGKSCFSKEYFKFHLN